MKWILPPPPSNIQLPQHKISAAYTHYRWMVFAGIFIGYAGYYLVRKNFSMVMPDLISRGYSKSELGIALSAISISYGISKLVMGWISDRCNARIFLPAGLFFSGLTMVLMGTWSWATGSMYVMFLILFINGWFQGMGWPPSGRVMVYWFSNRERGFKMSLWNVAHNVGGGLVGPIALWAVLLTGAWESKLYIPGYIAVFISLIAYLLIRDKPQSCGLPSIEEYKNDYSNHSKYGEESISGKELFIKYVLSNRLLWYIAFANVFIYMVRYGVLDWSPLYLEEVKGYTIKESGWAYFAYEYAGIPGTLLCGWLSDKVFKGKRAPATMLYMFVVLLAVILYWKNPPGNAWVDQLALITIGFFIYGPVMLIGLFAIDLVPKDAAGSAAGLTGFFGYIGGAAFANIIMGWVLDHYKWDGGFVVLISACLLAIIFMIPAWRIELKIIR